MGAAPSEAGARDQRNVCPGLRHSSSCRLGEGLGAAEGVEGALYTVVGLTRGGRIRPTSRESGHYIFFVLENLRILLFSDYLDMQYMLSAVTCINLPHDPRHHSYHSNLLEF